MTLCQRSVDGCCLSMLHCIGIRGELKVKPLFSLWFISDCTPSVTPQCLNARPAYLFRIPSEVSATDAFSGVSLADRGWKEQGEKVSWRFKKKKKKVSWFPFEGVTWKLSLDVTFLKPICKKNRMRVENFVSDFVAVIPNKSENNHWVAIVFFFFFFHSGNCRKEQSNADTRTSKPSDWTLALNVKSSMSQTEWL